MFTAAAIAKYRPQKVSVDHKKCLIECTEIKNHVLKKKKKAVGRDFKLQLKHVKSLEAIIPILIRKG